MLPHVILRDPDGADHALGHGDIVGRLYSAALSLDDGRVSEAHAMVSLREGQLQLIGLRGALAVGGRTVPDVTLVPGLEVRLARDVALRVMEVWLPDAVLGIAGPGMPRQMLPGVASVVAESQPRLVRGWRDDAAVQIWTSGDGWLARVGGGPARAVRAGDRLPVGDAEVELVEIPLQAAGPAPTRQRDPAASPVHLVAHFDTVHLYRPGEPALVLGGKPARLLSELVALDGPVGWAVLAELLWPDESDPSTLRTRLDVVLSRVRRKLRACGVRDDLVTADGAGTVGLVLHPHDTVENRT